MSLMANRRPDWKTSGTPWVWLTAGTVAFSLILVLGVLGMVGYQGVIHFWPSSVVQISLKGNQAGTALGEVVGSETVSVARLRDQGVQIPEGINQIERLLLKTGNRKIYGFDFKWFNETDYHDMSLPPDVAVIEREEWGNFYGFLVGLKFDGQILKGERDQLELKLSEMMDRRYEIKEKILRVEKSEMGALNYQMDKIRLERRKLELDQVPRSDPRFASLDLRVSKLEEQYIVLGESLRELNQKIDRDSIEMITTQGEPVILDVKDLVRVYFPNNMNVFQKFAHYFAKLWEFVSEDPREANTEGGIFPAIFGTVAMVLLMAVLVTPFGVVAAIYLNEYAAKGALTKVIRIAVNNLAGVPSVVYGVFGLGFFVYFLGGTIDSLFFEANAPAPVFGTPGLMWSSLTLALLTVPVVIVSTEEGLTRIPRSIREGSLALGATKAETLWRTVLPMATPAMMTGLILAVARAAGEVAPLMMVGVVKLAPALPVDGNFPFIHLDRKFMHMGFHIYDVGFQSPNVEAARPLVYATSFLLIILIISLNMTAIKIRNSLREKYNATET